MDVHGYRHAHYWIWNQSEMSEILAYSGRLLLGVFLPEKASLYGSKRLAFWV